MCVHEYMCACMVYMGYLFHPKTEWTPILCGNRWNWRTLSEIRQTQNGGVYVFFHIRKLKMNQKAQW